MVTDLQTKVEKYETKAAQCEGASGQNQIATLTTAMCFSPMN